MEKELEHLSKCLSAYQKLLDEKFSFENLKMKVLVMNRINELNRKLYSK
jgi:hypothetical protein